MEAKAINLAFTDCTEPDREGDFNEWYNTVHMSDILSVVGKHILSARRYRRIYARLNIPKYLAVYEWDAVENAQLLLVKLREENERWEKLGRNIDCLKFHGGALYEPIFERY